MAELSLEGMTPEQIQELAVLSKQLSDNPETRSGFLGLVKKARPDASIPEIDLPAQMRTMLDEERGKREALENKIREDDVRRSIQEKRDIIKSKGISGNEVAEVEKMMVERGITNHETAAEFYLASKKMATPTPPSGKAYESQQIPKIDAKDFGGNNRSWAKNKAAEIFQQIRNGEVVT